MANSYFYSNIAVPTTLSGNINNAVLSCTVASTTGWPSSFPYVVALDYATSNEELIKVTANAAGTLTMTRGFGGTSAVSHSIGAVVRHVYNAQDSTDFRTHEAAVAAVHGVAGTLVGTTDAQTLTNKTITAPAISAPVITGGGSLAGTFSGSPTFSGAVVLSGTPSISSGAALAGTFTGTPTFNGAVVFSGAPNISAGGALAGTFTGSPTFSGNPNFTGTIQSTQSASGNVSMASIVTADTFDRYRTYASGLLEWGSGALARDTNLFRDSANVLRTNDSLIVDLNASVTGNLTVTGLGAELHARKTSDTTVTSNATPSTDPHLSIAVPANTIWEMVGCLFYTSTIITGDLNYQFSGPAGVSGFYTTVGPSTVVNTDPPNEAVGASQSGNRTIATAPGSGRSYGVPVASSIFGLELKGMFEIAGTAGNITVDWSQSTSQATGTTMKIYSWFRLTRVA